MTMDIDTQQMLVDSARRWAAGLVAQGKVAVTHR